MCEVDITAVVGLGADATDVGVTGTVADCPEPFEGSQVRVEVSCGGNSAVRSAQVFVDGRWYVEFSDINCRCGEPVTVTAACTTEDGCEVERVIDELPCIDCPDLSIVGQETGDDVGLPPFEVECLPNRNALVTFEYSFTNTFPGLVHVLVQCEPGSVVSGSLTGITPGTSTTQTVSCEVETPSTPEIVIWLLDVDLDPIGCPPIVLDVPPIEQCPCQTDEVPEVSIEVDGCFATFTRSAVSADCDFVWNFDDGSPQETHNELSFTHEFPQNGTYDVAVVMQCGDCPYAVPVGTVEITDCASDGDDGNDGDGGGGGGGGDDGQPWFCGALVYVIGFLVVAATAATVLALALQTCLQIPVPAWLWGVIAGLWLAVAIGIAAQYLLCKLGICDCPTACDWLVLAWMAALAGAVVALYLVGCCPGPWWLLVAGFAVAFIATFGAWLSRCDPTRCDVLDLLLVAFASITATALSYIGLFPVIQACGLTWVEVAVATITAALAVAVPVCHANE